MESKRLYATTETERTESQWRPKSERQVFKPWLLDFVSLIAALVFLGAVTGLLIQYDGKPLPEWHGVTLNFVVSILAQAVRTAIAIPLADCLGQLKWYWFWKRSQPKRVTDFQAYEDASRSAWGSVVLLCKPRLWYVASIGAVLTVATLATEPFLQQMPIYPIRLDASREPASINVTTSYADYTMNLAGNLGDTYYTMLGESARGAFYGGIYDASSALTVQPTCQTGNCTWDTYSTLGLCSTCTDLASVLTGESGYDQGLFSLGYSWSAPNGAAISAKANLMLMSNATTLGHPNLQNYTLVDFWSMYYTSRATDNIEGRTDKPSAFECTIYFCLKDYKATVTDGQFQETEQSSFPNESTSELEARAAIRLDGYATGYKPSVNTSYLGPFPYANSTSLHPTGSVPLSNVGSYGNFIIEHPVSRKKFHIDATTVILLRQYLQSQFQASISSATTVPMSDLDQVLYESQVSDNGPAAMMQRLAASFTTHMRNTGGEKALGISRSPRTYVRVRWEWIGLPVAVLALTLVFLVATIVMSAARKVPVWRCSALPSLLYPLDRETASAVSADGPVLSKMEKTAGSYDMTMDTSDNWRLQGNLSRYSRP